MKLPILTKNASLLRFAFVSIVFLLLSWVNMGSSLTDCRSVVLGKPGDHTAGIMYGGWIRPNNPIQVNTIFTNYPFGENIWNPAGLTSLVPSLGHLLLSHYTNIVCGWNLIVLLGYMSNALIMFYFMRWLTRNSWVAFFSAYAVTFTPYHIFASWGQIAGLLGSVFTLALWQFLYLWRKPTTLKSISLGAILGLGFYIDGYFILIGGVMLISLWVASLSYGLFIVEGGLRKVVVQLKSLALTSITALLFLMPLMWINYLFATQIKSFLNTARGNIWLDSQTYSAQPSMYINPKGILFLGISVISVALIGLWLTYLEYRKHRKKINSSRPLFFDTWAVAILLIIATWVSLRPRFSVFGITFYNPSSIIIYLTSYWRVFGRLYVLVAIAFAVLSGLGLAKILKKYTAHRYWIFGICLLILVFELRVFVAHTTPPKFDYREAPIVYTWLKNNPDINALAEYPLDEPPQGKYLAHYYTFQQISGKPILNTFLPNSPQTPLRRSIAGINDPQTLPVLRALGINLVNIRPITPLVEEGKSFDARLAAQNNEGLERIFSDNRTPYSVDSFKLKAGKIADYALVLPLLNYSQIILTSDGSANYSVGDGSTLSIVKLPTSVAPRQIIPIAFDIKSNSNREISIVQNGKVLWSGILTDKVQSLHLKASSDFNITIHSQASATPTRLTITKMQVL